MPVVWRFRHYVDARGVSDVRVSYERGSKELKARFLSRLRILAQLPQREWHDTYYKTLAGPCDGLAEIRFKAGKVEQRPLGFHPPTTSSPSCFGPRRKVGSSCRCPLARQR